MNFNEIKNDETDFSEKALLKELTPWSEVFEFPLKIEPTAEEMQEQPYKGIVDNEFLFEFSGPLWRLRRQVTPHENLSLRQGYIKKYPSYIYSRLKFEDSKLTDAEIHQAIDELEAIITKGDMDFYDGNQYRGYGYKYNIPFYLSFLKSQVYIYFVDDNTITNATNLEGAKPFERFGVYCPYYKIVDKYYPVILLSLRAMRYQSKQTKIEIGFLFQHVLLRLFAYAFQDPTNKVDDEGIFEKTTYNLPTNEITLITYNEQEAEEFVHHYFYF